jgi:ABC-2 type transport system permease protein
MLLIFAITMSLHGVNLWHLLMLAHPFRVTFSLITVVPIYLLWALPSVGWLILCSAWARTKPFLWAVVLPIVAGVILSWFSLIGLNTAQTGWYWHHVIGRLLLSVFPGTWLGSGMQDDGPNDPGQMLDMISVSNMYSVLASPGLWIGVVAGVVMLAGAIWFRRWRDES